MRRYRRHKEESDAKESTERELRRLQLGYRDNAGDVAFAVFVFSVGRGGDVEYLYSRLLKAGMAADAEEAVRIVEVEDFVRESAQW